MIQMQQLNNFCEDLDKIKRCVFQWKMSFILDPSKQAPEAIFTCKVKKVVNPPTFFNKKPVQQVLSQHEYHKNTWVLLYYFKAITSKFNKTIGLLRKLNNWLVRYPLTTI